MLVLSQVDWPETVQGLKPGEHVLVFGDLYLAATARAAGLELRDTLAHVFPGGWRPIFLYRKPVVETLAETVLKHGTGAINIGACRTGTTKRVPGSLSKPENQGYHEWKGMDGSESGNNPNIGRWPSNLVFTHAEGCRRLRAAVGRTYGDG